MKNSSKKQDKPGRPKKSPEELHGESICCWLTQDSKDRITKAAHASGDAAGHWLGKVGDEAARRALAALGMA